MRLTKPDVRINKHFHFMCIIFTDLMSNTTNFNTKNIQPSTKVMIIHTQYFDSNRNPSNGHKIFKRLFFPILSHI